MWLIKFAVWFFMKRLMHGRKMNIFANVVFGALVVSFIALNVFNLTWCAPIESIWTLSPTGMDQYTRLTGGCITKIESIIIFDGVMNTFTDILCMNLRDNADDSNDTAFSSDLESAVTIGTQYGFYLTVVYQTIPQRPLLSWFCRHRRHHRGSLHGLSKGFHLWRQLCHMVQCLPHSSCDGGVCPANTHPLPQTFQTVQASSRSHTNESRHNSGD
jgi:hypothetical protein